MAVRQGCWRAARPFRLTRRRRPPGSTPLLSANLTLGLLLACPLLGRNSMRLQQSACGCVTSTSIRLPPRRESLAPPDGSGIHDLATLCSSQSPQSRILRAEYACGIIFPNPGMDQPLCLSDEVTSLFAALALTQSVRVF